MRTFSAVIFVGWFANCGSAGPFPDWPAADEEEAEDISSEINFQISFDQFPLLNATTQFQFLSYVVCNTTMR